MTYVLDSSAVIAFINGEPGGNVAAERFRGGFMSLVNAVEVGTKLIDEGMTRDAAWKLLGLLNIEFVALDANLTRAAIGLRSSTRRTGLSLADRACVATAIHMGAVAVTADRVWSTLDLGCEVELIR